MQTLLLPSWYPSHSGDVVGVFFRDQALALADAGHKVGVIAPMIRSVRKLGQTCPAPVSYEDDQGITTYRLRRWAALPRVPYGNYWIWRQMANRLLRRYLAEQGKPDIIHAHCAVYAGAVAAKWRDQLQVPLALTEHRSAFARKKYKTWQLRLARRAVQKADACIAVSPSLGDLLSRELGSGPGSWRWIPNVVASRFRHALADNVDEGTRPARILNLALMTENKGQMDLLQAFAAAFPGESQVELWLGGDGPLQPRLEAEVRSLTMQDRIKFLGRVDPDKVPALLKEVDVMAVASHYETFGVVVAEALMAGVPVVATKCGGPECIVEENDGILVPPHSPKALAYALEDIVQRLSDFDANEISKRAYVRFSSPAVAGYLTRLYEHLVAANPRHENTHD